MIPWDPNDLAEAMAGEPATPTTWELGGLVLAVILVLAAAVFVGCLAARPEPVAPTAWCGGDGGWPVGSVVVATGDARWQCTENGWRVVK